MTDMVDKAWRGTKKGGLQLRRDFECWISHCSVMSAKREQHNMKGITEYTSAD